MSTFVSSTVRIVDHHWAYFYNESQASSSEAASWRRPTSVRWDVSSMATACTLVAYDALRVIRNVTATAADGDWNRLSFLQNFAGWGSDLDVETGGYVDGRHTHPGLDPENANWGVDVWEPRMARAVRFTAKGDAPEAPTSLSVRGVSATRYFVVAANLERDEINTDMFFSDLGGLMNVSQRSNYMPLHVSLPHFYKFSGAVYIPPVRAPGVPGWAGALRAFPCVFLT